VADRIAVLHDGVIVETGPSQAIQGSANPMVQHFIRGEVEMTEKKP
jgi:ABC-type transporter Mla maintaining outer membrane lipid asymmetry ATPase subunit MlaF